MKQSWHRTRTPARSPSRASNIPAAFLSSSLEEIDSLMPVLVRFQNLEALNLSENRLKSLPANLSSLPHLHTLNINGNPFEPFPALIASLQTLPALRNLSLNLQQNEEVELTLNSLPNLDVLNDQGSDSPAYPCCIEIGHDESEGANGGAAEPEGGQLPPENSSPETQPQPQATQGPEPEADQHLVEQPQKEPTDVPTQEPLAEEEKKAEPEPVPEAEPAETRPPAEELRLEDLEQVVKIYDAFRAMRKRVEPGKDRQLEKEFDGRMSQMANDLKEALNNSQSTDMKNVCILKSRHDVLNITFEKMVDTVSDKPTADIWRSIQAEQNAIVAGMLDAVSRLHSGAKGDVHTEVVQAQKETRDVLEAAQHLESEMQKHVQEKEGMRRQFEAEKKELQAQVASLEEENKKYLDTIIKRSKVIGVPTPNIMPKDSPNRAADSGKDNKKLTGVCILTHSYIGGEGAADRRRGSHTSAHADPQAAEGPHPGYVRAEAKI